MKMDGEKVERDKRVIALFNQLPHFIRRATPPFGRLPRWREIRKELNDFIALPLGEE